MPETGSPESPTIKVVNLDDVHGDTIEKIVSEQKVLGKTLDDRTKLAAG